MPTLELMAPRGLTDIPTELAGGFEKFAVAVSLNQDESQDEELFGPDAHSPHWNPSQDLPNPDCLHLPLPLPPLNGPMETIANIKAHLYWGTLDFLKHYVLDGKSQIIACLFNSSRYPEGMEKAALFRKEIIEPYFGSVQDFFEFLYPLRECLDGRIYSLRDSFSNLPALFRQQGDEPGAQLAEFHRLIFGIDVLTDQPWLIANVRRWH